MAYEEVAQRVPLDEVAQGALLDEALKKSSLVWLSLSGRSHGRWHAWLDGRVYLLTGPGEQPDPGLAEGADVRVVVCSKDDGRHLLTADADVSLLGRADADWAAATAELARLRLNLPDPAGAPVRWTAAEFVIYRLAPRLPLVELPGHLPDDSRRRAPSPTPATTAGAPPRVLHRRGRRGRPLS